MAPGTVEPSKESDGKRSTGDRDVRKRWLGYTVQRNPAKAVEEIAPYTNVVIDHGWSDYGDALIQAAKRQHKKVVLAFFGKWERGEFERRGLEMARRIAMLSLQCLGSIQTWGANRPTSRVLVRCFTRNRPPWSFGACSAQNRTNLGVPTTFLRRLTRFW